MITFIDPELALSAQVVQVAVPFHPRELSTTKVAPLTLWRFPDVPHAALM